MLNIYNDGRPFVFNEMDSHLMAISQALPDKVTQFAQTALGGVPFNVTSPKVSQLQPENRSLRDQVKLLNREPAIDPLFSVLASTSSLFNFKDEITEPAAHGSSPSSFQHISMIHPQFKVQGKWVKEVDESLSSPGSISIIQEGIGVSYLIKNVQGKPIAIFKPDDEVGGLNNLKGLAGNILEEDTEEASKKEICAWILGGESFSVPEIFQVKLRMNGEIKQGSLQEFIPNLGSVATQLKQSLKDKFSDVEQDEEDPIKGWELRRSIFSHLSNLFDKVGTDIQGMGVLDILMLNIDRANLNNVLITGKGQNIKLIPIDHNVAFPKTLRPLTLNFWMSSPYANEPFNQKTLEYIKKLNIEEMSRRFEDIGLDPERIKNFKIMALLVKKGAAANLTLLEIAFMTTLNGYSFPAESELMKIVNIVNKSLKTISMNDDEFFEKLPREIDRAIVKKQMQKSFYGMTENLKNYLPLMEKATYETFESWDNVNKNFENSFLPVN